MSGRYAGRRPTAIPYVGDFIDAGLYGYDLTFGDASNAMFSCLAVIPFVGTPLAKSLKYADKLLDAFRIAENLDDGRHALNALEGVDNVVDIARASERLDDAIDGTRTLDRLEDTAGTAKPGLRQRTMDFLTRNKHDEGGYIRLFGGWKSDDAFKLGRHGDMPSPRPSGMESHHGVLSEWVKANFKGYSPNDAPAILMFKNPNTMQLVVFSILGERA